MDVAKTQVESCDPRRVEIHNCSDYGCDADSRGHRSEIQARCDSCEKYRYSGHA